MQKLHVKLKQEQQRWDRECVAREKQQVDTKSTSWLSSPFPHWPHLRENKNCFGDPSIPSIPPFLKAVPVSPVFPERAGEPAGGAGAAVPPGGGASARRARAAGGPAAGVPAEHGPAEGGPEERGDGEGQGGGPAEGPAELEAQPAEQPACYHPAG